MNTDPENKFPLASDADLRAELEECDYERKMLWRNALEQGRRELNKEEQEQMNEMNSWAADAHAELMRRAGLVMSASGRWVPKGFDEGEMTPLPGTDAPRFQPEGRVFRDAEGKPMRPPALRQLTDPAMHFGGGRVEQHAADMRAYYEASGEAPSPVPETQGCSGCRENSSGGASALQAATTCIGCRENQPNQLAHTEPGGCLYTEE